MDVSHDILVRLLMGGKTLFEAGMNLVVGGADAWSSSQKEFMADPAAGLSSFLAAVESSLS